MDPNWLAAIGACFGVVVSVISLTTSRQALKATQSVTELDKTIKLALADFREELSRDKLLINQEVIDYRFKGEDDKIRSLDHRTTRNTDHIAMIMSALLNSGVNVQAPKQER